MKKNAVAAFLVLASCCLLQASPDFHEPKNSRCLSFYFENDMFLGTDRCYTGGFQLSWLMLLPADAGKKARTKWLPLSREPGIQNSLSFALGQNIYTPDNITREEVIPDDRPYAGHLYLSLGVQSRSRNRQDVWEMSLGLVGPAALGKESQTFIHDLIDGVEPKGWHNQLHSEIVIGLVFERKWKILRLGKFEGFGLECIPHTAAGIGNLYVYASAGAQVKLGWNLRHDFGARLFRPGGGRSIEFRERGAFGIYAYAALDGKGVVRNIFLDGNTFGHSHEVQKRPWTVDFLAGVSMRLGRWHLGYEKVFWSKKFRTESRRQAYGALSLVYTF